MVEEIFTVFDKRGGSEYFGENVSQLEHALQAAALAARDRQSDELIAAALLHDVGHLLHGLPETIANDGVDTCHEDLGNQWLTCHFPPAITEPIRLHVAAKRYMCAVEPEYFNQLSTASLQSLKLQGGPMSPEEVVGFESNAYFRDAVTLRRYDDQAKLIGWQVPGLEHYRELLERQGKTNTGRS